MKDIRDVSFSYLTYRSRTEKEMRCRLMEKGYSAEEIDEELVFLKEHSYIDDRDYARQYIEYGFSKKKGILLIEQELKQKGIASSLARQVFSEEFEEEQNELDRATEAAGKLTEGKEIDEKLLAKVGRSLMAKGYSSDIVYQVLGKLMRK